MFKKISYLIYYWLPSFIYMSLIFYLSSRKSTPVSEEYILNFVFYKTIHVVEYAILYFLLFRSFFSLNGNKLPLSRKLIYPFIVAAIYAASDELHQTFVPTREGRIRDVFIDFIGIFLMYIYIKNNIGFIKKII